MLVYKKVLENYPGGVRFAFREGKSYKDFVFSTDLKLEGEFISGGWRANFDLLLANSTGGSHLYYIQFTVSGGHLYANMFNGTSSLTKYDCGAITKDDWVNIKTVVSVGDGTSNAETGAKLTLYVNDVEIFTSSDVKDSSIGSIFQAMIIPNTSVRGTMYIDNTKLEPID